MNKNKRILYDLVPETYEEYLEYRNNIFMNHDQWVLDIFSGAREKDRVIYSDDKFILAINVLWDDKDLSQLSLLAFVKNVELKTIRDLTQKDVPLLKYIINTSYKIIENKYGIKESKIRSYFHYRPTTNILHIHFNLVSNTNMNSSVEYSYSVWNVIENLNLDSDYYKKITMMISRKL